MKNPTIAALLNIIPGLGYLYVGRRKLLGTTLLIFVILSTYTQNAYDNFLTTNFSEEDIAIPVQSPLGLMTSLSILLMFILIGAFMYDAYADAKARNTSSSD